MQKSALQCAIILTLPSSLKGPQFPSLKLRLTLLLKWKFKPCHHIIFLSAGDRAEGAEATLESSLNKLTLTVAQEEEGDSGDDQDPPDMNPEHSSSATNSLLLLNGV